MLVIAGTREITSCTLHVEKKIVVVVVAEEKGSENRGKSKNRRAAFPILFALALHTHRRGAGSAFRLSNAVKKIFLK